MAKCEICGKETDELCECEYCGRLYCSECGAFFVCDECIEIQQEREEKNHGCFF